MKRRDFLQYTATAVIGAPAATLAACGGSEGIYSNPDNWLHLPTPTKDVDVFYVYPTAWSRKDGYEPVSCPIDYPMMRAGAGIAYKMSGAAFETAGNIFAPFYSQMDSPYVLALPEAERWDVIANTPGKFITEAFGYFINKLNNGRSFILAGHSQGSQVLLVLLSEYMKQHPEVYKRMIAAYLIGYPVTAEYIAKNPHLKFAEGPDDTGVIISYNTQSNNLFPAKNVLIGDVVGLVINPISWTRTETLATTAEGLGSYMPDPTSTLNPIRRPFVKVAQYADAQVNKEQGVLICTTADENEMFELSPVFGKGNYHSFDYPFYYFNIRQNAENRANKFLSR